MTVLCADVSLRAIVTRGLVYNDNGGLTVVLNKYFLTTIMKAAVSHHIRSFTRLTLPQGASFLVLIMLVGAVLLVPANCYAGPGGEIVELAFKTTIGRYVMAALAIIFLPLIIWVMVAEKRGISKTKRDLGQLSLNHPAFNWQVIEKETRAIIERLYAQWSTGDISSLQGMLAAPYLQSQQDILDRWNEEGRRNVTELKKVRGLAPLHVIAGNQWIVRVKVELSLKDYLIDVQSNKVVKGSKRKVVEDHEAIWSLVYLDGAWQLFAIDDGSDSLSFARAENEINLGALPAQMVAGAAGASKPAALDPLEDELAAEEKEPVVEVSRDKDNQR